MFSTLIFNFHLILAQNKASSEITMIKTREVARAFQDGYQRDFLMQHKVIENKSHNIFQVVGISFSKSLHLDAQIKHCKESCKYWLIDNTMCSFKIIYLYSMWGRCNSRVIIITMVEQFGLTYSILKGTEQSKFPSNLQIKAF